MGGGETQEVNNDVYLNPELAEASQTALGGAQEIYNQGTSGIYQGTQLANQDPLVRQAQQQQLAFSQGGMQNQVDAQQGAFTNLLQAGDLEGNSVFQRQLADALEGANTQFQRGSVPIFQQGTAAGQFGSSEVGESLGLFGGEVNRNMQNAITQAALGGQQVAMNAQQLAPQSIGLGLLPSQINQDIGNQRTARSQQELANQIQQYEAPRNAQLRAQSEFQNFLASNPLVGEQRSVQGSSSSGNDTQAALGLGATVVGAAGNAGGFSNLFGMGG